MSTDETSTCPICRLQDDAVGLNMLSDSTLRYRVSCPRCHEFIISHEFLMAAQSENWREFSPYRHLLSGLIREMNEENEKEPEIYTNEWQNLLKDPRIPLDDDIQTKANKLLTYLRKANARYGKTITFNRNCDMSIAYAKDYEELGALFQLLADGGYLTHEGGASIEELLTFHHFAQINLKLTAKGWELGKELGEKNINSDQCFIAIRFENQDEKDDVTAYIEAISAGIRDGGYTPKCIKGAKDYTETIMNKALTEIRKSRIVVIDLTGDRMAVSFEAGFAFALGIDAVYICKNGCEAKNFYARHYPILGYDTVEELRGIIAEAISSRYPRKTN